MIPTSNCRNGRHDWFFLGFTKSGRQYRRTCCRCGKMKRSWVSSAGKLLLPMAKALGGRLWCGGRLWWLG